MYNIGDLTIGMKTVLTKWGNSMAVRIPKPFAEQINVSAGEEVEIIVSKNTIVLRKNRHDLSELLKRITPKNVHKETDTGKPLGKEIW